MEAINNHTDFPVLSPRTATPPQGPGHLLVSAQSASESEGSVAPKAASSWTPAVSSTCSQAQQTTVTQFQSALFSFRDSKASICFRLLPRLAIQAITLPGQHSTQGLTLGSTVWRQGPTLQKELQCKKTNHFLSTLLKGIPPHLPTPRNPAEALQSST